MNKFLRESEKGFDRIDTEAGVIYGVKVLGPKSRNGRIYEDAAIRRAVPMYEGVTVNLNHQRIESGSRAVPDRQIQDRWGVLRNARYAEGSVYADLHYLKNHPMTPQLIEAADRFPDTFGLSHDAAGDEQVIDGERRVIELFEIRSVDVVAEPATNNGLFECCRTTRSTSRSERKRSRLALLEVKDGDGDGKINDGKASEAPAPPKQPKAAKAKATKSSTKPLQTSSTKASSTSQSESHFAKNKKALGPIIEKTLGFDTTETRNSDDLDFVETSVWAMRKAGQEAFVAGSGRKPTAAEQTEIDKVLKKNFFRSSLATTNSSDDFSEIHVTSARRAIADIHQQGLSAKASAGSNKNDSLVSKLSQADKIDRAKRRAERYGKMSDSMYSEIGKLRAQSEKAKGKEAEALRAKVKDMEKAAGKLLGKRFSVEKAIRKVTPAKSPFEFAPNVPKEPYTPMSKKPKSSKPAASKINPADEARTDKVKVSTVKINGKAIRTQDNPLNTWVRSLDDGKLYRNSRKT